MKKALRKKWKAFRSHSRRTHEKFLDKECEHECEHLGRDYMRAIENEHYDRASRIDKKRTMCERSCYIRRSELAYSRKRRTRG